jgi:hypothetical protein
MEPVAALPRVLFCRLWGRFPFPLPPRTIGEQKAKVKVFSEVGSGPNFLVMRLPGAKTCVDG